MAADSLKEVSRLLALIPEAKTTSDARDFISKKIGILRKEGMQQNQAVAAAHSMARDAGYTVPDAPKEDEDPEKNDEPSGEPEAAPQFELDVHAPPAPVAPPTPPAPDAAAPAGDDDDAEDDDDEEGMDEAIGLSPRHYNAAKAEFANYHDFINLYKDGSDKAFKTVVSEGDDPIVTSVVTRPRKSVV